MSADVLLQHCRPPRLSQLVLRDVKVGAKGFRLLASPPFCNLESHTLVRFQAAEPNSGTIPTVIDYAATFAAMHALRTLELRHVTGSDALLGQMHHAPILTAVRIGDVSWRYATAATPARHQPSLDTLRQLLIAAPHLRVQLLLSPRELCDFASESRAMSQHPAPAPANAEGAFDLLRSLAALERVEIVQQS